MTRPFSDDLRERVVAAVLGGESRRSAAKRFGISISAAVKLLQRHRATGSVAPGKMGGHRKRVLEPHRAFIEARIRETPHLTLHGLKDELAGRGVKVSHNAVWLFLRREGLSFKKSVLPAEQLRPKVARRRVQWKKFQHLPDPARLVFVDETWAKTNMAPSRVWAPRVQRPHAKLPYGPRTRMNFPRAFP